MSYMFYNCYILTSLNIDNFKESTATNLNSMFESISLLISLNLINFKIGNAINLSTMFGRILPFQFCGRMEEKMEEWNFLSNLKRI